MRKPEKIEAVYRIVTPMFIGDADQKVSGITAASVKGALRFWWRALNWGRVRGGRSNDEDALKALHEEEAELFGSSTYDNKQRREEKKQPIGQCGFLLRITESKIEIGKPIVKADNQKENLPGLQYLLGQGLFSFKKGVLRDAILEGEIRVECLLRSDMSNEQKCQLQQALLAMGTLGGLGSRSRKGFGSLAIIGFVNSVDSRLSAPQTKEDLKSLLCCWMQSVDDPPFTAFAKNTRIDLSLSGKNAPNLLNKVGEELQLYRSWGKYKKVNGKPAEQKFPHSHDLMLDVANLNQPSAIPDKAVFGLPQNYFFSSADKYVEFSMDEQGCSRRASPLFMHVHQFPNGDTILIQALFPAVFLSDGASLKFSVLKNEKIDERIRKVRIKDFSLDYQSTMTDWENIKRFMDRDCFLKETIQWLGK